MHLGAVGVQYLLAPKRYALLAVGGLYHQCQCSATFSGLKRVCTLKQGTSVAGMEVLILTLTLDLPCFSVHWGISGSF